ncbi:beta family protein [Novosphingobium guangzhouense]|uniref:beta family protein n=1 Tax=Novosphingobium guangzhouense TaxID=1850347 RepID=UPI0011AF6F47|nr:hypothetical protein [Novosphingobium guangzhouense]
MGQFSAETYSLPGSLLSGNQHGVYKAIVNSGDFAGKGFSSADTFIANAAENPTAGPGNSTTWRQLNTTHHITQVVSDIAKVRGILIKNAPASEEIQLSMFG